MDLDGCRCKVEILRPKDSSHKLHGKCASNHYTYGSLPTPKSIRLLKIPLLPRTGPHRCDDDLFGPIKCSMITVDLDNSPSYAALSYSWGDPKIYYRQEDELLPMKDWYCQCYEIEVDDQKVTISANLYAALVAIRYIRSAKRYSDHGNIQADLECLWIDALCINQSDLVEKSKQVLRMQQIYLQSKHCLIWLGGSDSLANTAIPLLVELERLCRATRDESGNYPNLKHLTEKAIDQPDFYEILNLGGVATHISIRQWSCIFAFLNRSWYRRAWVTQEFTLSRSANFLCGLNLFDDRAIKTWMMFLRDMRILPKLEEIERLIVVGYQLTEEEKRRRNLWPNKPSEYTLYKSQDVDKWDSDILLFIEGVRQQIRTGNKQHSRNPAMDLEKLPPLSQCVLFFRSTEASDPRDKIYALLGISHNCSDTTPLPIIPDYTLDPCDVYIQAAKFMVTSDNHLSLLSMVEDLSLRKMENLPSWVPDFSVGCRPSPFCRYQKVPFWAGRGLGQIHASFPEPKVLQLLGYRLNKVSATAISSELEKGGIRAMAKFLSVLPRVMMIKKPIDIRSPPVQQLSLPIDLTLFTPQSRLEMLWRTQITDTLGSEHPAPEACGIAYKISCRKYLFQCSSRVVQDISNVQEFSTKWQELMDENDAFESILLPGEMKSLRQQIAEIKSEDADGTISSSSKVLMLDGGDWGDTIPSEWLDRGENLPWDDAMEGEYMHEKGLKLQNRKLAVISPGGLALVPESTAIEDEVWIIAGSQVPFVLRPVSGDRFKLIGEAYVHGIMHGEGMEGIDLQNLGIRYIKLV